MNKFHHEMLPTDFFQKTAEIHRHNTRYATNQNYFIQQVSTNVWWFVLIRCHVYPEALLVTCGSLRALSSLWSPRP